MFKRLGPGPVYRVVWGCVMLVVVPLWVAPDSTGRWIFTVVWELLIVVYVAAALVEARKILRGEAEPAPARTGPRESPFAWVSPATVSVLVVAFAVAFVMARVLMPQ